MYLGHERCSWGFVEGINEWMTHSAQNIWIGRDLRESLQLSGYSPRVWLAWWSCTLNRGWGLLQWWSWVKSSSCSSTKQRTMADVQPSFLWETPHCLRDIYMTALMSPFSNEIPRYHGIWLLYWCLGDSHCGFGERDPGVPGPRRMVLTACNLDLRRQGFEEAQGSLVLLCLLLLPDQTAQRHELTDACRVYIFLPVLPPEDCLCVAPAAVQQESGQSGFQAPKPHSPDAGASLRLPGETWVTPCDSVSKVPVTTRGPMTLLYGIPPSLFLSSPGDVLSGKTNAQLGHKTQGIRSIINTEKYHSESVNWASALENLRQKFWRV